MHIKLTDIENVNMYKMGDGDLLIRIVKYKKTSGIAIVPYVLEKGVPGRIISGVVPEGITPHTTIIMFDGAEDVDRFIERLTLLKTVKFDAEVCDESK